MRGPGLIKGVEVQERGTQRRPQWSLRVRAVQQGGEMLQVRVEVTPGDRVLRGVVPEQRATGDPGGQGNVFHADFAEAVGVEQINRDIGDPARSGGAPAPDPTRTAGLDVFYQQTPFRFGT